MINGTHCASSLLSFVGIGEQNWMMKWKRAVLPLSTEKQSDQVNFVEV